MTLESIKTFVTRYQGEDGRERAVLFWEHYEQLCKMAEADHSDWSILCVCCDKPATSIGPDGPVCNEHLLGEGQK